MLSTTTLKNQSPLTVPSLVEEDTSNKLTVVQDEKVSAEKLNTTVAASAKITPYYPPVLMPPTVPRRIKAPRHDFF